MDSARPIRVLIVDDSAIVRRVLSDALAEEPGIEVVGTAPDPFVAHEKLLSLRPDVLTLDIEMPRMDGLTFLQHLMRFHPIPVIIISSVGQGSCRSGLEALRYGAVEVLAKPGGPYSVRDLKSLIASTVRAAAAANVRRAAVAERRYSRPPIVQNPNFAPSALIAIGSSTGGIEAIEAILRDMPRDCPSLLITQHIPAGFSRAFAERLDSICCISVKEAAEGDEIVKGRALIAPGNHHMLLTREAGRFRVAIKTGPPVCYQRPSVDVLFTSVAETVGRNAIAALLTGMGSDGAQGMLRIREAGGRTLAQDEATSVVFGMPREAIRLGAAEQVLALPSIPGALLRLAARKPPVSKPLPQQRPESAML